MSNDIVTRVCEIAADVFGESTNAINPGTTPDDLESWDSLAHLNLMLAIEDEFSITLVPDDIEAMGSPRLIATLIESRRV